jgi:hypothetical protein
MLVSLFKLIAAPTTAAPTVAATVATTTASAADTATSSDAFWKCVGSGGVSSVANANGQVCCPTDACAECGK